MMKIFICSPYQGNIEENKKKAAYYAKIVARAGNVPVAPHIYFPTFLDEKNPNERMTGIEMRLELMDTCDMVYVFGFEITEGMRFELEHAKEMKKPVRLYDRNFEQICVKTIPIDDRASDEYRSLVKGLKLMR